MKILMTGSAHPLARALTYGLGEDVTMIPLEGDLLDAEAVRPVVAGADAIIHALPLVLTESPPEGMSDTRRLDSATRGTYHLLSAAGDAGIPRCLLLSSLRLFEKCPEGSFISEWWMPRPDAEIGSLCLYSAEVTAREFAREEKIAVLCLRFARPVRAEGTQENPDPAWIDMEDAVSACRSALEMPLGRPRPWLFHIAGGLPGCPYSTYFARRSPLGFTARRNFGLKGEDA
ncbi:MAG: NAD(P)-dependent oxidoreductase [Armatimonadetes bacterium]|nr:NAD(P)-dependent oxidoreductase [Armatimonadota bacterium]